MISDNQQRTLFGEDATEQLGGYKQWMHHERRLAQRGIRLVHVLSLGAGVQSSVKALMAERGEILPRPDFAVFADPGHEPPEVYAQVEWLRTQVSFPIYVVDGGDLAEASIEVKTSKKSGLDYIRALIPAFTKNPDGSQGRLGRKCTREFKVEAVQREIRRHVKLPGKGEVRVCVWLGISTDEATRMKDNTWPYAINRWPLIEKDMSRLDCLLWMSRNGYPEPPRSACIFCPNHDDAEWHRIKTTMPEEFEKAAVFEERLRAAYAGIDRLDSDPFLHRSMKPLREVEFDPDDAVAPNEDCEGLCGT